LCYDRNVNEPWWRKLLAPFPGPPFSISILRSLPMMSRKTSCKNSIWKHLPRSLTTLSSWIPSKQYGNTGCGVSKMVGPKKQDFCPCSKEILIPTSLNHLWFSVVRVLKADYLDFPWEIFEIMCELDVGIIACIYLVFGIFLVFSVFFGSNSFIFEPKIEKIYMGVFSTQFGPLNSNLVPKIM
jgi:hypothetical protein